MRVSNISLYHICLVNVFRWLLRCNILQLYNGFKLYSYLFETNDFIWILMYSKWRISCLSKVNSFLRQKHTDTRLCGVVCNLKLSSYSYLIFAFFWNTLYSLWFNQFNRKSSITRYVSGPNPVRMFERFSSKNQSIM